MINLISIVGESAKDFYLKQQCISDFKSLMRAVTSGRVMIISTKFRSDLLYNAEEPNNDSILKLWALYANASLSDHDQKDFIITIGDERSLSTYFQSINKLSANWYLYGLYKMAFLHIFNSEQKNPVAKIVVQCDQYLLEHTSIKRTPLFSSNQKIKFRFMNDNLSIAMRILNDDALSN